MICFVIEVSMDNGKDVILQRLGFIGINNAIAQAALGFNPYFQAPNVVSDIPKFNLFADMVSSCMVVSKIVIQ